MMTEKRISELRSLCIEYELKKVDCEAAGLKEKAADIAADGVGRRALEALQELLDYIEKQEQTVKVLGTWLANAYIDPGFLPEIGKDQIDPPSPEDVIEAAWKKEKAAEVEIPERENGWIMRRFTEVK